MPTISEILHAALKLHENGSLAQAEQGYREILAADPQHPDAWHLLGLVVYAHGDLSAAEEYIRRAIECDPAQPSFYTHLADVYRSMGDLSAAEACCREALLLKPDFASAHNTLGAVLNDRAEVEQAAACFRQALVCQPNFPQADFNLGSALQSLGKLEEAIDCYRAAIRHDANDAQAYHHLGSALRERGMIDESIEAFRQALRIDPQSAEAANDLGALFQSQSRWDEAIELYRRALAIRPNLAEAHCNLGVILQRQAQSEAASYGKLNEAIKCYQYALEYKPNFAEVLHNLGNIFKLQGRRAEAAVCYEQSLRIKPDSPQTHYSRALLRLAMGDLANGWREHEWRFDCEDLPQQKFSEPRWQGERLETGTLLVHAEQGLGDALQFIRYLPIIEHCAQTVVAQIPESLLPLLEQSGFSGLIGKGGPLPTFDRQVSMMSLPLVCGTTLGNIPAKISYLSAKPELIDHWRGVLRDNRQFKLGIAWQGNAAYLADRFRSIPLANFSPLALPGVELVRLQKGRGSEQLAVVAQQFKVRDLGSNVDEEHGTFMDTAAIMKNLDLVVTSDTALAHLAGGLGVPVWLALPFSPDWRWLFDRDDTPWYPTMRLFRQTSFDDWRPVFRRMAEELARLLDGAH